MRINHNITALNTYRQYNTANNAQAKSMEKLSSGMRINNAADDAAGLAISEKMRGQIRGLDQASRNAQDGVSLIQTAEGASSEIHSILQRMRELSVQSANGTLEDVDKAAIKAEGDELIKEVGNIADNTKFNGKSLLAADVADVDIQIGANKDEKLTLALSTNTKLDTGSLGLSGLDLSTGTDATETLDTAIETVSKARAYLGANQNRLEHTINNLSTTSENLTASESRIRDVDMAKEMSESTKTNILQQAATAMLAQANQQPQGVLQLLR